MTCPSCGAKMTRKDEFGTVIYVCPKCGERVTLSAGQSS